MTSKVNGNKRGDHLTAEYRVRTEGRGRTVNEWKLPAHKPDNHWFDCVVGCAAAASMRGVERIGVQVAVAGERKKRRLSELQRERTGADHSRKP